MSLYLLTGCSEPAIDQSKAYDIAEDVAEGRDAKIIEQIAILEGRLERLEAESAETRKISIITAEVLSAEADRISANADVANENAVADMTARGACGYTTEQDAPSPGFIPPVRRVPIPCTLADLKK